MWIQLYRVEKVLTNSNYILRKMGTNYTQCVYRIRLRPVLPQHQPEELENIDPSKFETDLSLGKYQSEPAPARIRLSEPLGGPAAAPIAPATVPIPAAAKIVAPLPLVAPPTAALPQPALPPDPDPEPLVPPEFDYNDGLINDKTMNDAAVTMSTTVNLGNDRQNMTQETSRSKRKAAVEARDKMFYQTRFNNDVRYHPIPPRELQPRKFNLLTVDGHEVAPVTFSPRSTQNENRSNMKKTAEEANEYFPPGETKRKILKDSVKRAKQLTKTKGKDGPGSSKDSVNSIYDEPNIFVGPGNVLQFPGSVAHCVSSDYQMAKRVAKQISNAYPCIKPTL